MLRLVTLVDQWRAIQPGLPEEWGTAQLRLIAPDREQAQRAAVLLAPAHPGRLGRAVTFFAARRGDGPSPDLVTRLLQRLDREGIEGQLKLVGTDAEDEAPAVAAETPSSFVAAWEAELAALPDDWSDLYIELELFSTDYLERAALLVAPLNPARDGGNLAFRARVARRFGYGTSPQMTMRCLERLDAEGIRGSVRVLRALSDTRPVQTQGPVWYEGGRSV
ncbi:MAG TPA: hypothetical protein VKB73_14320 [Gaiellaceae bacterium]|nr:hypothetical protein [Gaiellaceae bacterium]